MYACLTGAGQGVWKVVFDPVSHVQHVYTIEAVLRLQSPIVLSNVLFGDVWVCSGQSNMKLPVEQVFCTCWQTSQEAQLSQRDHTRCFLLLNILLSHSKSFKMTPLTMVCKSLLVFHCNCVFISYCFWDIVQWYDLKKWVRDHSGSLGHHLIDYIGVPIDIPS